MRPLAYFEVRSEKDKVTGCWIWKLKIDSWGYGQFGDVDRRIRSAHRGAWEAAEGSIPEGKCICHRCDNPACVNPAHLFLGTHADNTRDKVLKGRQSKGSSNGQPKMVERDVSIIKTLLTLGVQQRRLAKLHGVSENTISLIKLGRAWRHVVPAVPR